MKRKSKRDQMKEPDGRNQSITGKTRSQKASHMTIVTKEENLNHRGNVQKLEPQTGRQNKHNIHRNEYFEPDN